MSRYSSSYSSNSSVSCAGISTWVARTTGSRSSGSGGAIGGSGSYGIRAVAAVPVRRMRPVVVAAASRVAVRMLATDAPVSSRMPASSRKANRMCEPAVENSFAEVQ